MGSWAEALQEYQRFGEPRAILEPPRHDRREKVHPDLCKGRTVGR